MHIFLESSRRAHVKPNATTVPFSRYSRSNGFLEHKLSDFGSLWVPPQMSMSNINLGYIARLRRAPNAKGEKTRAGHVYGVPSCKLARQSVAPPPRYLSPDKEKTQ